jgi:hypothetical protein
MLFCKRSLGEIRSAVSKISEGFSGMGTIGTSACGIFLERDFFGFFLKKPDAALKRRRKNPFFGFGLTARNFTP